MTGRDAYVWYAAFGSNLSVPRMTAYLAGGRPTGARRHYDGCRDPSPPVDTRVITLEGRLSFGGESRVWGGGMAFFTPGEGLVHARAYLVRVQQLGDLVAQESRHPVGVDLVLAQSGPTLHGLSKVYDVLLDLGLLEGHRLLTLTSSEPHPAAPPSAAYLRTMLDGLGDGFGLDASARVAYLGAAEGVTPAWTREELGRLASA